MKRILSLAATLALCAGLASPAMAKSGVVILTPGGSAPASDEPTAFMGVETARVLPSGLGYLNLFGGPNLNYNRGMGGGGELNVNLGLNLNVTPNSNFTGSVGAGWKQQFSESGDTSLAFDVAAAVTGLGGMTNVSGMLGLPISFGPALHIHPRFNFPNLATPGAGTSAGVGVGLKIPVTATWQLLGEVTPTYTVANSAFSLPGGIGARFSPNALSHVDFTLGNLGFAPGFSLGAGLLGVSGYIGF